ncbi:MAG: cation diffusion facilitator family transporter [Lysobacterales bacterium]|jgi:cation diffusion facilitator family transporter
MAPSPDSMKSILFALGANFSIAVAKGFAAFYTGSGAMLAEAIHSLADSGNQGLLLLGMKQSRRPPNMEYPLGFGKSIYFWSFLVAMVLFSLGGMFSVYEGWHKLNHPEELSSPMIAVGVLIFAILAETVSLWGCIREVNKERYGRNFIQWFKESRSSELVVVFGEDIAALLGLALALIAIVMTMVTGNPVYDSIGSVMIGVLLFIIAYFIAVEVKALLIGQSVEPRILQEMREFLQAQPEVDKVFNLLTMQMGHDAMVAVKAQMAETGSERGMLEAINNVESRFKECFPVTAWLFFEPDYTDND